MSKLARITQKIFGSAAGLDEIAKFGSLSAGTPAFTTDPTVIQSLSNYLQGWFAAVIGNNSPAIEDMNALFFLCTYQLAQSFQDGVPSWDGGTTYYTGGFVSYNGDLYKSITDTNLNNLPTDPTNWRIYNGTPSGAILPYGGDTASAGYLLCDGASYLRTDYPNLFSVIGVKFGSVDGTHFNVPNMGNSVPMGLGTFAIGDVGGEAEHVLSIGEMPSHNHPPNPGARNFWGDTVSGTPPGSAATSNGIFQSTTTGNTGGGGAHNNLQPYVVTNYIIKT